MTLSTVNWGNPTVQWGHETGGVWTTLNFQDGVFATCDANSRVGFILSCPGLQFNSTGRPLDNPVVVNVTLRLPVLAFPLITDPRVIELWFQPGTTTPNFGPGSLPLSRGEESLGLFTFIANNALNPEYSDVVLTNANTLRIRAFTTSRALWDGRLAFVLESQTIDGGFMLSNGPSLPLLASVTQEQAFSGLVGYGREHGRVRAVRDTRFGIPTLSNKLVRDGDRPGLWVFPTDRDEKDPVRTYRPSPREGSRDDEVPG